MKRVSQILHHLRAWFTGCFEFTPFVVQPEARLMPHNHLVGQDTENPWTWQSTGEDPHFLLTRGLPLPGWHMLEVAIEHDQPCVAFRLYYRRDRGFEEETSIYLPVKNNRITKRLLWLPFGVKALRIDPMETEGSFTIRHLRFAWLNPGFALDRLAQRLSKRHFQWRNTSKNEIIKSLKQRAAQTGQLWRTLALAEYEDTFERFSVQRDYGQWLKQQNDPSEEDQATSLRDLNFKPLVSILLPVYNPAPAHLNSCLESVLAQVYPHWQLCIADDASTDPEVHQLLAEYALQDQRIELVTRERNGHICAASNTALKLAKGEYLALLDHDDCLTPDALLEVVKALDVCPEAGIIYSDEDKIDEEGKRFDPHFKPDWNPDLLLAQNYISHLCVLKTALVQQVGGFREGFEGSQDHDLVLRVTACLRSDQIVHVPKVLYHWRALEGSTALGSEEKDYTSEAGLKAVGSYLAQHHPEARAEHGDLVNTYRVHWPLPSPEPLVSLLVPTRDRVEILQPCVDAILQQTDYRHFELLILDNESRCPQTLAYLREVEKRDPRVRVLHWAHPFNYSAINNFGARQARGEILGLVNNDIEPINPGWLTEMVRQACRPEIGCVGAKLYYPNDSVQHGGVILGIGGVAGHAHKYYNRNDHGYFSRLKIVQNLSAVTGACLLVKKSVYQQVGGLDEDNLPVSFNDVDFCLRVKAAGYANVWTPYAELYHHESISRGSDDTAEKRSRAQAEVLYMRERWGSVLDNDPAYNTNLTLVDEDFSLRFCIEME